MWGFLTGLVGLISAVATWYVANHPRIRYRKLLARIEELNHEMEHALVADDLEQVAACNHELVELRRTHQILAGL